VRACCKALQPRPHTKHTDVVQSRRSLDELGKLMTQFSWTHTQPILSCRSLPGHDKARSWEAALLAECWALCVCVLVQTTRSLGGAMCNHALIECTGLVDQLSGLKAQGLPPIPAHVLPLGTRSAPVKQHSCDGRLLWTARQGCTQALL
jgi:hypothetical protein